MTTDTERWVCGIVGTVLGVGAVTPDDDIVSLGGDSLQIIKIALEIERRLGRDVEVEAIDPVETLGALAAWIDQGMPDRVFATW